MNSYDTLDELYLSLLNDLLNAPYVTSRAGDSQEIIGWTGRLLDPSACFLANPCRALPPFYPAAELTWYLRGDDSLPMITAYAPQYERFANEGLVHGAYGKRWTDDKLFSDLRGWFGMGLDYMKKHHQPGPLPESEAKTAEALAGRRCMTQMATVIQILGSKPDSRQAIMTCWNAGDLLYSLAGTKNDIPCTLSLQFLLRDGKLNLITTMRSNDAWLGVPNDIFCFCHLQMIVATALRVELGWYQHNVGSMHLYSKNRERGIEAAMPPAFDVESLSYVPTVAPVSELIEEMTKIEEWNRANKACFSGSGVKCGGDNSLFGQLAYMMATRWTESADKHLNMKTVRRAAERTRK